MSARLVLAADVGGTKTNLAMVPVTSRGDLGEPAAVASYGSHEFRSFEAMIEAFRDGPARGVTGTIAAATVGFAGPIVGGRGEGTHVPWSVDASALARYLGLPRVGLINDLVATGYGVLSVRAEGLAPLLSGASDSEGNAAIIAAGTGLGETILARVDGGFLPIASEGGHADFAPRTDLELEIWRGLRERYGRVSVERLLSGPGLAAIAEVTHARAGAGAKQRWSEHEREAGAQRDLPAVISQCALEHACPACEAALTAFVGVYGSEAGNLALRCVAKGGIYVGGGIAPRILPALRGPAFERAFRDKPPHEELLAGIPVWVVLDDKTAVWGAARHALKSLATRP